MSDLRYDPVSGVWVAIARNRRDRPMEFIPLEQIRQQMICPFCRGNEEETPEVIAAYKENGEILTDTDDPSDWTLRIVPNKFPSLLEASAFLPAGPYQSTHANGVQEIVIPTGRHVTSLSELTLSELQVCWLGCQDRISAVQKMEGVQHTMMFMNCRLGAGASLGHIHLQVMASPIISGYLEDRWRRQLQHFEKHGRPLVQSLVEWELEQRIRVVRQTEHFVVVCPYASRFSFQIWIVPRDPELGFIDRSNESMRTELAELTRDYVRRIEELLDHPAYNLLLHLAPPSHRRGDLWFVEAFPRITQAAGYELGTDIWVNPVTPESAAKRLRS
jgi:UDPglucose--hexose-1-phosphate uridylyltransferase